MADSDEPKPPRRRKAAGADADASSSSPAKKPPTARSRAAAEKTAGASEKPAAKPARAARKKTATEPTAEAKPATTRARAAAKRPAADKAAAAKPARTRAKTSAAEPAAAAVIAEADKAVAPEAARTRRPIRRGAAAKESATPVPVGFTVRAQARYVRSSARKARLVCDHIRGKSVPEARAVLAFAPRGVAKDWAKLLDSAIANAENNHELVGDELHVTTVYADEGPTLKRFTPRAMGRATPIHKRTSHLTIMLGPKE